MVFRFMESRESSDNLLVSGCPGYDNDQEQDAVTIPIKSRKNLIGKYKRSRTKACMDSWNVKSWNANLSAKEKARRLRRRKRYI